MSVRVCPVGTGEEGFERGAAKARVDTTKTEKIRLRINLRLDFIFVEYNINNANHCELIDFATFPVCPIYLAAITGRNKIIYHASNPFFYRPAGNQTIIKRRVIDIRS